MYQEFYEKDDKKTTISNHKIIIHPVETDGAELAFFRKPFRPNSSLFFLQSG
jgi:hypothetical protein